MQDMDTKAGNTMKQQNTKEQTILRLKKEAQKLDRILFEDGRNFVMMTPYARQQMIEERDEIYQRVRDMGANPLDIKSMPN